MVNFELQLAQGYDTSIHHRLSDDKIFFFLISDTIFEPKLIAK